MRKNGPVKRTLRNIRLIKWYITDKSFMRKKGPIRRILRIVFLIVWSILDFAFDLDTKYRRIKKLLKPFSPIIYFLIIPTHWALRVISVCILSFLDFMFLVIIAFTFMFVYHTLLHKGWHNAND